MASSRRKRARDHTCHFQSCGSQAHCAGLSLAESPHSLAFNSIPGGWKDGAVCLFPLAWLSLRLPEVTQFLSSLGLPQAVPTHSCLSGRALALLPRTVADSEYKPYIHWVSAQPGTPASEAPTSYPTDLIYMFFPRLGQCSLSVPSA